MVDDGLKRIEAEFHETPAEFLAALGRTLCKSEQVDSDLAKILSTHLLTEAPTSDAVTKAKDAIDKLAKKRAARSTGAIND